MSSVPRATVCSLKPKNLKNLIFLNLRFFNLLPSLIHGYYFVNLLELELLLFRNVKHSSALVNLRV